MATVTRDQIPNPPNMQPRGLGPARSQSVPPSLAMRPRSGTAPYIFWMRGILSGGAHVYWLAQTDDKNGDYYVGNPKPTDILLVRILGVLS